MTNIRTGTTALNEENGQGSSNQARPDWMRWSEDCPITGDNFSQEVERYRKRNQERKEAARRQLDRQE